jgi:chromosome segregation protein
MYLKELEVFGFKSFPEKTRLIFEPGITVVVGPNGCGKSNVFDAIKWSLGEQSPKSLRGAKMEDVIFNGTEHHHPLGYCEVSLTFSNEDNYLPIDFKEVAIARRLYRSGESQYFLNKNQVRLKDIEDLFMGTGIGEATYSFVEQGKIEIFLSYKPEDKRLIFDEASGIVKYKDRKKETLKRLQETDDNLIRLEDILTEVTRQTRYLERQVEKAQKYKDTQGALVDAEKKIARLNLSALDGKTASYAGELENLKNQESSKENELSALAADAAQINEKLVGLRTSIEEVSGITIGLSAQIENSQSHIVVCGRQIGDLQGRCENLLKNEGALKERLNLHEQRVSEEHTRCLTIDEELKACAASVGCCREESESLIARIDEARKKANDEKAKVFEFETDRTHAHNRLIEIQTNLSVYLKRKQRLVLDKARIEDLLKEKEIILKDILVRSENFESTLLVMRETKNVLVAKDKELKDKKEELKNSFITKEKELVELNSYYDFLRDLKVKYDIFPSLQKVAVTFKEHPGNVNKLVASFKGVEFINENGLFKAEVEAKIISHDESELEMRIEQAKATIAEIAAALSQADCDIQAVGVSLLEESARLESEEAKYTALSREKEDLYKEMRRFSEEFELVELEFKTNTEAMQTLENDKAGQEQELKNHDDNLRLAHFNLTEAQNVINKSLERMKELDIEMARQEAQRIALNREKETLVSQMGLFEEEKLNIINSITSLSLEREDNLKRSTALNTEIDGYNIKIGETQAKIEENFRKKSELEHSEVELLRDTEQKRRSVQALEKELQRIKESSYDKKLDAQSVDYEKQKIFDYVKQVYELELDLNEALAIENSLEELNLERDRLLNRKRSLGEVNLVAIEEFEELKTRKDFLEQQKNDLVESKENLKKAIGKINKTCRDMFMETFTKVQEEFKKNFRFLFNGGNADLILVDPENVLESGVEIEVQPPGKKLQNVSLLSGGEKALTAISLIFAIFRVKPSPLCVLDEIDAPLDESNVDRFNNILKEFAVISQFVVITHNKKTMANADVLYGVTMQEKGVSKLVSVKLNGERKPLAQTPSAEASAETPVQEPAAA